MESEADEIKMKAAQVLEKIVLEGDCKGKPIGLINTFENESNE